MICFPIYLLYDYITHCWFLLGIKCYHCQLYIDHSDIISIIALSKWCINVDGNDNEIIPLSQFCRQCKMKLMLNKYSLNFAFKICHNSWPLGIHYNLFSPSPGARKGCSWGQDGLHGARETARHHHPVSCHLCHVEGHQRQHHWHTRYALN